MKNKNIISKYVEGFFTDYLVTQRSVSLNTIKSYRDVIKLFLLFISQRMKKDTVQLKLDDLNVEMILDFLKSIERKRRNGASTRNHRLAVLRAFFSYLGTQEPEHLYLCQKVMLISFKKSVRPMMEYLELDEINAILKSARISKSNASRDFAVMSLMYNTGSRVQEICDLKVSNLRLQSPPLITITGKGNKMRQVPIWKSTQETLKNYLYKKNILDENEALFTNLSGKKLSRYGVRYILNKYVKRAEKICPKIKNKNVKPHTIRHTTAMHLLQSGVDLNIIKSWLGHVDVSTTHGYIEIDMEMKRKALQKCRPTDLSDLNKFLKKNDSVITWLESL